MILKIELQATIHWQEEWVPFLQAILMTLSLYETALGNKLKLVQEIRKLAIDYSYFEGYNFKGFFFFI